MIEFVCIGYDVRQWPCPGHMTIDATEWEREEELFERVKDELGTYENHFQLLEVRNNDALKYLVQLVRAAQNAALVSFEAPRLVVDSIRIQKQWTINENCASNSDLLDLGYDVCDSNGLFSILHMGQFQDGERGLFKKDDLVGALNLTQAANFMVPAHAPFMLVNLKMLLPRSG